MIIRLYNLSYEIKNSIFKYFRKENKLIQLIDISNNYQCTEYYNNSRFPFDAE